MFFTLCPKPFLLDTRSRSSYKLEAVGKITPHDITHLPSWTAASCRPHLRNGYLAEERGQQESNLWGSTRASNERLVVLFLFYRIDPTSLRRTCLNDINLVRGIPTLSNPHPLHTPQAWIFSSPPWTSRLKLHKIDVLRLLSPSGSVRRNPGHFGAIFFGG